MGAVRLYLHNILGKHVSDLVQKGVQRGQCRVVQSALAELVDHMGVARMDGGNEQNPCLRAFKLAELFEKREQNLRRWREKWSSEEREKNWH